MDRNPTLEYLHELAALYIALASFLVSHEEKGGISPNTPLVKATDELESHLTEQITYYLNPLKEASQ